MGHYNHSLSINASIMVSTNCPIVVEQLAVIFMEHWEKLSTAGQGHCGVSWVKVFTFHQVSAQMDTGE